MKTLGVIGFGNMGEAAAAGLRKTAPGLELGVVEPWKERAERARGLYGCRDFSSNPAGLAGWADVILVAVKPQDAAAALAGLGRVSDKRFISIMAGKSIEFMRSHTGARLIARLMPNLAAAQGKALVGLALLADGSGAPAEGASAGAWADFREETLTVARAMGRPLEVPEKLMAAVTGLSGSGIAFAFAFIHALALGGVKSGLAYPAALDAALQVTEGAVAALRETGTHPAEFISRVASPAGTTIAGLLVLEKAGFNAALIEAVDAASRRAEELEA
jgi:pyrroline-5-carboxylate reductase